MQFDPNDLSVDEEALSWLPCTYLKGILVEKEGRLKKAGHVKRRKKDTVSYWVGECMNE